MSIDNFKKNKLLGNAEFDTSGKLENLKYFKPAAVLIRYRSPSDSCVFSLFNYLILFE